MRHSSGSVKSAMSGGTSRTARPDTERGPAAEFGGASHAERTPADEGDADRRRDDVERVDVAVREGDDTADHERTARRPREDRRRRSGAAVVAAAGDVQRGERREQHGGAQVALHAEDDGDQRRHGGESDGCRDQRLGDDAGPSVVAGPQDRDDDARRERDQRPELDGQHAVVDAGRDGAAAHDGRRRSPRSSRSRCRAVESARRGAASGRNIEASATMAPDRAQHERAQLGITARCDARQHGDRGRSTEQRGAAGRGRTGGRAAPRDEPSRHGERGRERQGVGLDVVDTIARQPRPDRGDGQARG